MADLGTIGVTGGLTKKYVIPVDTAWARSISANPPTCFSRMAPDSFYKPRYRDQWYELRGTVKNSSGTGIARRVIAIDNRSGVKRGEVTSAGDGTFTMKIAATLEAVTVIAIQNAGDQRNAAIFDAVVPVVPL
jgi:hypothetical protein